MSNETRVKNYILTGPRIELWENEELLNEIAEDPSIVYLSIGRHTGHKTGYEHVHINVEFSQRKRWKCAKEMFGNCFDIQARRGRRDQADKYLGKDGRFRVVVNRGEESFQGRRNDIDVFDELVRSGHVWEDLVVECSNYTGRCRENARKRIEDLYIKPSKRFKKHGGRDVQVHCYFGPSGSGKTTAAMCRPEFATELEDDEMEQRNDAVMVGYSEGKTWWDGVFAWTRTILLDEFNGGWMPFSQFCQLVKAKGAVRMEVKGSFSWPRITTWIITSIRHPNSWWKKIGGGEGDNDFEADREQLWRRLDHIWWVDRPESDGEYLEPVELDKEKFKELSKEDWNGWMKYGRKNWCERYGCDDCSKE